MYNNRTKTKAHIMQEEIRGILLTSPLCCYSSFNNEWNIMLIDELCAAYTSDGARSCAILVHNIVDVELSKGNV